MIAEPELMTRRRPDPADLDPAEHEPPDLHGLVADWLAGGPEQVHRALQPLRPNAVLEILVREVEHRATVLLREARGSRLKAHDLLAEDWKRWHP